MTVAAVGVSVALILIVLIALWLMVSHVLTDIENEYSTFKAEVDKEKSQFSDLLRDTVPAVALEHIQNGEGVFADTFHQLTFIFTDVKGFTEMTKSMGVNDFVRTIGFTFYLQDTVAEYYNVTKIKSIGDSYFGVTGVEQQQQQQQGQAPGGGARAFGEEGDEERDMEAAEAAAGSNVEHPVYRAVAFGCAVQLLCSHKRYTAYPERLVWFAEAVGERNEPLKIPTLRVGLHTARCVAGILDPGRAAQFDCYGEAISLAQRIEGSCAPGAVNMSLATRDALAKVDAMGDFFLGAPQSTMPKRGSAVTTFTVIGTMLRVPNEIVDKLAMTEVTKRRRFEETGLHIDELDDIDLTVQHDGMSSSAHSHQEL
jgi:class 3 adenylate cyclase